MSIKSACYKAPGVSSHVGNLNCDIIEVIMTGAEVVDTPILLRKMSERNKYVRATIVGDTTMVALTEIDVGYIDREAAADDLVALADGAVLTVASQDLLATAPLEVPVKHDICFTPKVNNVGNAGKKFYVILEFVANSG